MTCADRAADGCRAARRRPRCAPARRWLSAALLVTAAVAAARWATAADPPSEPPSQPGEYTVKAAFLYGFGQFVQWPSESFADSKAPFVIALVGEDSFGGALDEIAAKRTIQHRRIVVRRFATSEEYRGPCHIMFLSRSLTAEGQALLLKKTAGKPVLTVGETPGVTEKGGIVNFFVEGDRIRFEINAETARRAQLHMDAKLLNLGKPADASRPAASTSELPGRTPLAVFPGPTWPAVVPSTRS
jgi:hypothetical protein